MINEQNILEEIARVLKLKITKGPRRALRVILMGTVGSETESQANLMNNVSKFFDF